MGTIILTMQDVQLNNSMHQLMISIAGALISKNDSYKILLNARIIVLIRVSFHHLEFCLPIKFANYFFPAECALAPTSVF